MAPSVRGSKVRVGKSQSTLRSFSKISKNALPSLDLKVQTKKAAATAQVLDEIRPCSGFNAKRRREEESDSEGIATSLTVQFESVRVKKPKLQLATPPRSSRESSDSEVSPATITSLDTLRLASSPPRHGRIPTSCSFEDLPQTVQSIISIHQVFLKALSIHYAHNGRGTPAELSSLLTTITVIWKKRRVVKEDIQRMLAMYEIADSPVALESSSIEHTVCPFKLSTSGLRTCVEYLGGRQEDGTLRLAFDEKCQQTRFRLMIMEIAIRSRTNPALGFFCGPLEDFPLLACSIGAQTLARKENASSRLNTILDLSAEAQTRKQPKVQMEICQPAEKQTESQVAEKVKSRTQSLFDRVRAKQLANSTVAKPTAEEILRRHAIGRIAEIVDILRMKQQQKMSANFVSAVHLSPSKMRTKVSFSLTQLVHEIKGSVSVPIADDEAKMCLKLLAEEVPGFWVSMFEMGTGESKITSVVLNGQGDSGVELRRMLEEKEKSV